MFLAPLGVLFLAVALPSAEAQFSGKEINGYVRAQGRSEPPPGTVVELQGSGGGVDQSVRPDSSGRFTFSSLGKYIYYVVAKAPGYREASQRVDLVTMVRATVHLNLVPEATESPTEAVAVHPVSERELAIPAEARKQFEQGARMLMQEKKPQQAIPHLQKAVKIYPDYYEAYQLMGTAYMDQQKWPDAEQALKKSIALNDQYAPSLVALGAVYNREGRFADALPVLEKAEKLDPDSWLCHLELAQSLLPQGKVEEAEPHARAAHEKNPQFPLVHLAMANLGLAKGDLALAREECQHFLNLVPQGPLAEMVKAKMNEIDTALAEPAPKQ
ncbi:MAG: tetratricopeptide repeat protein [Gemmataceae bacterium]|nr:tetratricopeptide repeat protein [Gemmataceae bacterium]